LVLSPLGGVDRGLSSYPAASITGNLVPGFSSGEAITTVDALAA
jgi:hypothetical protein